MQEQVERLHRIFDGDEEFNEDTGSLEDLFREVISKHWQELDDFPKMPHPDFVGVTGADTFSKSDPRLEDTPRCLYRLLYLVEPDSVDFSDMYKTGELFRFYSLDRHFAVLVELFKYEIALYFYCREELVERSRDSTAISLSGGWASCNNGVRCSDPLGRRWFELVVKAASRKWTVYGGNDFEV